MLLVRQTNGAALYFLLVSRDGKPVNKEVLGLVAEPVEITGEVERQGEVRRAKLTYLRKRLGKGATLVKEKEEKAEKVAAPAK